MLQLYCRKQYKYWEFGVWGCIFTIVFLWVFIGKGLTMTLSQVPLSCLTRRQQGPERPHIMLPDVISQKKHMFEMFDRFCNVFLCYSPIHLCERHTGCAAALYICATDTQAVLQPYISV